jgi:hypothetical protein
MMSWESDIFAKRWSSGSLTGVPYPVPWVAAISRRNFQGGSRWKQASSVLCVGSALRGAVTVRIRNRAELAAACLEEIRSSVLRFGRLLSGGRAASASCLHLTPPKDVRLNCFPRCPVPPLAVYALTREWKDVGSNMILSQSLHGQPRVWISISYEVLQTSISCHHALVPTNHDAPVNQSGAASERTKVP